MKRKKENKENVRISWRDYDRQFKEAQAKKWAKRASQRLRELNKRNMYSYATESAQAYFKRSKLTGFTTSVRNMTESQLNGYLAELENFLDLKTSTVRGARIATRAIIENLKNKGVNSDRLEGHELEFEQFLHSEQFRNLKKLIDSDILFEDIQDAFDENISIDNIMSAYESFLTQNIGFDEVEQIRRDNQNKIMRGNNV
jgi:hypothetical protein|nr:MAG TPA: hypothetical protein [Caudoviricetes sp.]